jgi:hypothetical protein
LFAVVVGPTEVVPDAEDAASAARNGSDNIDCDKKCASLVSLGRAPLTFVDAAAAAIAAAVSRGDNGGESGGEDGGVNPNDTENPVASSIGNTRPPRRDAADVGE